MAIYNTQEADGLIVAYFLNSGSKNWGGSATGFEGFKFGFGIYMTPKKNLGQKNPVETG